jgi:hypothetical protein
MENKNNGKFIVGMCARKNQHDNLSTSIILNNSSMPLSSTQIITHNNVTLASEPIDYSNIAALSSIIKIFVNSPRGCNIFKYDQSMIDIMINVINTAAACNSSGVIINLPYDNIINIVNSVKILVPYLDEQKINTPLIFKIPGNKPHPTKSWENGIKLNRLVETFNSVGLTSDRIGLCIDTANIFNAGINIKTRQDVDIYMKDMPISWIRLIHLNGVKSQYTKTIPMSSEDIIWGNKKYEDSGCYEFIEWAKNYNINVILEDTSNNNIDVICDFIKICGRI